MIHPTPSVTFAGITVQSSPAGTTDWGAVVLDDLTVRYGRDSAVAQPAPGSVSIRFIVAEGKLEFTQTPMNRPVTINLTYGATTRVLFRGKVRAARVEFYKRRESDGLRLFYFDCEAVDPLADLASQNQYTRDRPEESATARLADIASKVPHLIAGIGGGGGYPQNLAPARMDGSILDNITGVYATTGEAIWYDPQTNRVEASGPVEKSFYTAGPLQFVKNGLKYSVAYAGLLDRVLDLKAMDIQLGDAATVDASGNIGAVRAVGKLLIVNSGSTVWQDWAIYTTVPGGGAETMDVDSQGYAYYTNGNSGPIQSGGLGSTGAAWAIAAEGSQGFAHPNIAPVFTNGFASDAAVNFWLSGREQRDVFALVGSVYGGLTPDTAVIVRAIGGSLTYRSPDGKKPQRWEADYNLTRVKTGQGNPVTPATVNPSAPGTTVRLADIDDTITCEALKFTATGV